MKDGPRRLIPVAELNSAGESVPSALWHLEARLISGLRRGSFLQEFHAPPLNGKALETFLLSLASSG